MEAGALALLGCHHSSPPAGLPLAAVPRPEPDRSPAVSSVPVTSAPSLQAAPVAHLFPCELCKRVTPGSRGGSHTSDLPVSVLSDLGVARAPPSPA